MRAFGLLALCAFLPLLPTARARAADDPLVQVDREIGVTATGLLTSYKENFAAVGGMPQTSDRELGWIPGVTGRASTMFDLGRATHLFAAVEIGFLEGDVTYRGGLQSLDGTPVPGGTTNQNPMHKAMGTLQLGKGFELDRDRLMLTPLVEYGRQRWGRTLTGPGGYYESYVHNWVSAGLRLDYLVTQRTVLRLSGTAGATLRNRMQSTSIDYGEFNLRTRPTWSVGAGLDHRLVSRLHVLADVSFRHVDNGESNPLPLYYVDQSGRPRRGKEFEPASWTQELAVSGGLAWSY